MSTAIPYADETWSVVTGCTPVSRKCDHCWAKALAARFPQTHAGPGVPFSDVRTHRAKLHEPIHWKTPKVVFVAPRGDLFHDAVPDEFIAGVFMVMAGCLPEAPVRTTLGNAAHTFLLLTARPDRMLRFAQNYRFPNGQTLAETSPEVTRNIWFGVSIEDQHAAIERVSLLVDMPAAHRWLSIEPLLGPIDLIDTIGKAGLRRDGINYAGKVTRISGAPLIDAVIVGGESGPGHRPMQIDWLRSIVEQCRAASVPCYVKQDSHRFEGRQGRIPDDLWQVKELPWRVAGGRDTECPA